MLFDGILEFHLFAVAIGRTGMIFLFTGMCEIWEIIHYRKSRASVHLLRFLKLLENTFQIHDY